MNDNHQLLRDALDEFGVTDPSMRAGIAAITLGESGFQPRSEMGWAHSSNDHIRNTFGSRVAGLSDTELDRLKASDEAFFNRVYGGTWGAKNLGNTQPGDGFKFRGRGDNQLTGRGNYAHFGPKIGVDLLGDPDLVNDPKTAAKLDVVYMLDRLPHGGTFDEMKRAVGISVSATNAVKNAAYAQFMASGEFAKSALFSGGTGDDVVAKPSTNAHTSGDDSTATDALNDAALAAAKGVG